MHVFVPSLLCRAEYDCFQIELSKNYGATVFLFSDTQVLVLGVCILWKWCVFIPRLYLVTPNVLVL